MQTSNVGASKKVTKDLNSAFLPVGPALHVEAAIVYYVGRREAAKKRKLIIGGVRARAGGPLASGISLPPSLSLPRPSLPNSAGYRKAHTSGWMIPKNLV